MDLSTLASCSGFTLEHAEQAASSAAERFEGELRVELSGDDLSTSLVILCEYGVGIREKLFPLVRFEVPLDEFDRALELAPQLVLPLRVTREDSKLVLTPLLTTPLALLTPEQRILATAPPMFEVEDASLGEEVPVDEKPGRHDQGNRTNNVHTRPTVRRMVAVDAAAIAALKRRDPRREDD